MPVKDYCRRPAVEIDPEATVRDAARRMLEEGVGCLLVSGPNGPIGILTDRDAVLETFGAKLDPGSVRVRELAHTPVVSVGEDRPLAEAARLFRRHGVRRLPVVDSGGKVVGLIAADDVFQVLAHELGGLAAAIGAQLPGARKRN